MNYADRMILSLDCESEKALALVDYFINYFDVYKIGFSLLISDEWKTIVNYLKHKNKMIIVDINLFGNTHIIKKTFNYIKKFPIDYVTINLLGGADMIKIAKDTLDDDVQLIGNTLHTSYTTTCVKQTLFAKCNINDQVERLTRIGVQNGVDGIICSGHDNFKVEKYNVNIFNNGIRYKYPYIDHNRVSSPYEAFKNGADYIFIGREIYDNENPFLRYQEIKGSLNALY